MQKSDNIKNQAIEKLNRRPEKALISLLRSQTIDCYAKSLSSDLIDKLESIRDLAMDGTKLAVDAVERKDDGYLITLDQLQSKTLFIADEETQGYHQTLGGGLCNLSKDLGIILNVIGNSNQPSLEFLTWQDAVNEIPGTPVEGKSRTSLIFQNEHCEKLIVCERGPTYDAEKIDVWDQEKTFYGDGFNFIFIGQEPFDSDKFEYIRQLKLLRPNLKVFWLVGGNQLKSLYTEYKSFFAVVDVVSLNLGEAAQFFGFEDLQKKHNNADELRRMYAREISRRTLRFGASYVVITDGAKRASLARQARGGKVEFVYSPLIQENSILVDSQVREDTGCGDSFAASVAAYFLLNPDRFKLKEATNFAHYIAGIIYQRSQPNLAEQDREFVKLAYQKAQQSGAFVGKHENFSRNICQIKPAEIMPRGPRKNVLVLIIGGNPADPSQPGVTGACAALEYLGKQSISGEYPFAPLIKIVPRIVSNPNANGRLSMKFSQADEMTSDAQKGLFCKEMGNFETTIKNGVLKSDLEGHEGVYLLRVTLLEALEILSSEDFIELFGDIKFWHFVTEDIDERLVWHAKKCGVSKEQSQEVIRQQMRDYLIQALGPQYRFSRIRAGQQEEFNREMTNQLILRVNALLSGVFRQ